MSTELPFTFLLTFLSHLNRWQFELYLFRGGKNPIYFIAYYAYFGTADDKIHKDIGITMSAEMWTNDEMINDNATYT